MGMLVPLPRGKSRLSQWVTWDLCTWVQGLGLERQGISDNAVTATSPFPALTHTLHRSGALCPIPPRPHRPL